MSTPRWRIRRRQFFGAWHWFVQPIGDPGAYIFRSWDEAMDFAEFGWAEP